jgi:formate-dependent phosphoribosylglycinamide formyltransferase (GAR transformylase)
MIDDKKVLLVLGGLAQVCDIVEDAKKKGVYVIVADYLESSPAKKMADESHMISITDVEGIVQLCKERHVDGVMNYCIDPGKNRIKKYANNSASHVMEQKNNSI